MDISKKLKQLMKVLLVVFMSLTVIVPDGLAKAETHYLSTNKSSYSYGEEVLVTVSADYDIPSGAWVGLYRGEISGASSSWYYRTHEATNILSTNVQHQHKINRGGKFYVVLFDNDGEVDHIEIEIEGNPNGYLSTNKEVYAPGEPIYVTLSEDYQYDGYVWIAMFSQYETPGTPELASYRYLETDSHDLYSENNILDGISQGRDPGTGKFDIFLMYHTGGNDYYNVVEIKTISIESPVETNYIRTDKDEYTVGEPILVTAATDTGGWVSLLKESDRVDAQSFYWYYPDGSEVNIFNAASVGGKCNERLGVVSAETLPPGDYKVAIIYEGVNGAYTYATTPKTFTVKSDTPISLRLDYSNALTNPEDNGKQRTFKYGQELTLTYSSASVVNGAWIGLYSYSAVIPDDDPIERIPLKDFASPVNYYDDTENDFLAPGRYKFVLFKDNDSEYGYDIETNTETELPCIQSFFVAETYDDTNTNVIWNFDAETETATITFKRVDDATKTKTFDAVVGEKTTETAPTCTATGLDKYPLSFAFTEENTLVTVNGFTSFNKVEEVVTPAAGHKWSEWEYTSTTHQKRTCTVCGNVEERDVEPHDHAMVHHDAVDVTCTTDGNIEYYQCTVCGFYFSDAAGEHEINAEDVVIKAQGHKYGNYICENDTHHKECSVCGDIIDAGDCTYQVVVNGNDVTKTCTVCGNVVETHIISTDKEVYGYEDPLYVTISEYDCDTGYVWVAMYPKGATPAGSNPSMYWYDNSIDLTKPVDIRSTDNSSGRIPDYTEGGEYDIVLMYLTGTDNYYNVVARKTVTINPSAIVSSLRLDKGEVGQWVDYKYNEPIMVTAVSPNPNASIRLCDADEKAPYHQKLTKWYIDVPLSEISGPIDILDLAIKEGVAKPEAGKKYRVYLIEPMEKGDTNTNLGIQGKFNLLLTYYDDAEHIVWNLDDDHTTATVKLTRYDDDTKTTTYDAVVGNKTEKTAPTCTKTGIDTYPLSFTVNSVEGIATVNGVEVLSTTVDVETAALGHDWTTWSYTTQTHQKRTCQRCGEVEERDVEPHDHKLVHHEAVERTCTSAGTIEYWQCSVCGFYFSDANGEHEIDEQDTIVAALGHDYSKTWTFDEEKHEHYKECSRCKDRISEACTFENMGIVGGSIVHTCEVCNGSYEDKFFWVDKTEFKQFEPIICHVDLSVIADYAGLDPNNAWVGMYGAGTAPAADISVRWHYVKNMGTPEEGLDMLTKIYGPEEGGSGTTNGYDWLLNQAGNLELYLLADGGYDKRVAHLTITLTEETLACGDIAFEFDGKDPAEEEKFEYTVPLKKDVQFKATVDGDPYGAWFGIYEGEYEKEYNFSSLTANKFWYLRDVDGAVSVNDYISKPGKYTMVVYATGGYEDMREFFWVEVTKEIAKEEVTIEPTCTEAGSKLITYTDGTTENVPIPALGHDWGEWVYDGEEAKTHTRTCKNDSSHTETVNCEFDEGVVDGDVTTYTCKECGGQYTYTRVASDAPLFRASGDNRYLTALTAADVFMEKTHKSELDTVVLACGSNFADALAGSYLAAVKNAPIILIDDNNKAATVEKYLKEHVAKGGLIYILGGDKAVAPKFESDLKKAGFTVKRLAGSNRYGTNLEILKEAGIQGNAILVSTGTNFADSLSASASGLPVLLVKDKLTAEQKDFLSNYNDKKIYILGGTNAVNKTVEGELGEYGTIKRLNGANRYETSVKIAEEFLKDADTLVIAVGDNFPDGLCGGALAYQIGAPVILVKDGRADYAKKLVEKKHIEKGVVLGGTNALKDTLINEIFGRDPKTPVEVYVKK